MSKRAAKLKHKMPDGAKAFQSLCEIERPMRQIENMLVAIDLISDGTDDERTQRALSAAVDAMGKHLEKVDTAWRAAWHLTWGYVYLAEGSEPEAVSAQS